MNEANRKIAKIQRVGKRLATALRIANILLIISALFFGASALSLLFPSERELAFLTGLDYSIGLIRMSVLWVFTGAVCVIAMLFLLERILQEISEDHSPFTAKQVKRIRMMALLGLVNSLVSGFSGLLNGAMAGEEAGSWQLNWPWLLFAAAIWCLSLVFDYGCLLQKESDEML